MRRASFRREGGVYMWTSCILFFSFSVAPKSQKEWLSNLILFSFKVMNWIDSLFSAAVRETTRYFILDFINHAQ